MHTLNAENLVLPRKFRSFLKERSIIWDRGHPAQTPEPSAGDVCRRSRSFRAESRRAAATLPTICLPCSPPVSGMNPFCGTHLTVYRTQAGCEAAVHSSWRAGGISIRRSQLAQDTPCASAALASKPESLHLPWDVLWVWALTGPCRFATHVSSSRRSANIVFSMECLTGVALECNPAGYPRIRRAPKRRPRPAPVFGPRVMAASSRTKQADQAAGRGANTSPMMWIVRLALRRPYTFVVFALLILILGVFSIESMPTDIFPNIDIPVVTVVGTSPASPRSRWPTASSSTASAA